MYRKSGFKKHKSQIKKIRIFNTCWQTAGPTHIKKRTILKIKDDAIHLDHIIPLDSLELFMDRHYNNYRKSPLYREHPQKALITIDYEEKGMENLTHLLIRITDYFDEIRNDNLLIISLEGDLASPPPPKTE